MESAGPGHCPALHRWDNPGGVKDELRASHQPHNNTHHESPEDRPRYGPCLQCLLTPHYPPPRPWHAQGGGVKSDGQCVSRS